MSTGHASSRLTSQEQARYLRQQKTQSASAYGQQSRQQVPSQRTSQPNADAIASQTTQRPRPAFTRAYSAPLGARGQISGLGHNFKRLDLSESTGDSDEDDEGIASDPFFQRFTAPEPSDDDNEDDDDDDEDDEDEEDDNDDQGDEEEEQERDYEEDEEEDSSVDGDMDADLPLSPMSHTSRARSSATTVKMTSPLSPQSPTWPDQSARLQEINIAVVGSPLVGKSTFIQRAFDLRTPPHSPFAQRKMSIDGNVYVVRLIELKYGDLDIDDDKRICWPTVIEDVAVPVIDGAFILYDVMNKSSIANLLEALDAVYNASTPLILVSCKCDNPAQKRVLDPAVVDQRAKALIGDLTAFQTSYTVPDSQKRCVAVLLRAIVSVRNQVHFAAARRRANSTAPRNITRHPTGPKHSRANSETLAAMLHNRTLPRHEPPPPMPPPKSYSSANLPSLPSRYGRHDFDRTPELDQIGSDEDDSHGVEQTPPPAYNAVAGASNPESGLSVAELVDRLLAPPMSKLDNKFVDVFLALYRKFCAPSQLLEMMTARFDAVDRGDSPQLIKAQVQLRDLGLMNQWISMYPGDFAHPMTKRKLEAFVDDLAPIRLFSVAAKALTENLAVVAEDDDTDWAFCDKTLAQVARRSGIALDPEKVGLAITGDGTPPRVINRSAVQATGSASAQLTMNITENAQKQARNLVYRPKAPLTKDRWRALLAMPDEAIAKEMTRIDWLMFESIRPRDLIRHVSLSSAGRAKCKALENVERMIHHFNHVALWVTNFVLFRDKPKHRALMLEKFMKLARELRKLNNYNALGAIVAGINNTSVHRLQATKDLLPPATAKDFMKLEILMSSQKSHSAYRLAWDNTPGERIPYLPLHRRDLVSASEGNRTFIGITDDKQAEERWTRGSSTRSEDMRINWKKFEIMGEVVVGLQKAQAAPYPLAQFGKSEEVRSLLTETEIDKDEDSLYERSLQVEASSTSSAGKKRLQQFFQGGGLASAFGSGVS